MQNKDSTFEDGLQGCVETEIKENDANILIEPAESGYCQHTNAHTHISGNGKHGEQIPENV